MPCAKARGHSIDDNTYHDCGNIAVRGALAIHHIHSQLSYPEYYITSDRCRG
jgi:hypothetical protein